MKSIKKIIVSFFLALPILFLYNCANPVSPGGGPRDEEPPQVLSSEPPNNSIFFDKKRISISFDEYVKLKNPNQQVLISPPFASKPEYRLRGKTLIIDIEEELHPNTTYTIFFGNAIVDLAEENPLINYLYAFSTGDHVDSLAIGGEVVNAFDLKHRENIFVMLFPENIDTIPQDSIPMLSRPLYVAKTDVNGQFQLRNLRNESFRLFALNDVDGNYLFNQPNEEIAFLDSLISPEVLKIPVADTSQLNDSTTLATDSTRYDSLVVQNMYDKFYSLFMFQQVDSTQRLLNTEVFYPPKFRITFQFAAEDPKFTVVNQDPGDDWKIEQLSKGKDTLTVWVTDMALDSLQLAIADGDTIYDTVMVSFSKAKRVLDIKTGKKKKKDETVERLKIKTNTKGRILDPGKHLRLIMENPLESWDFSTTTFIAGDDTITGAPFKVVDSVATIFELDYEMIEASNYGFIFPDSVFFGIYGLTNDSLQASFSTGEIKNYGNFILNVEPGNFNYIIKLMDQKETPLMEFYITEWQSLKIENLKPGTYLIKAIQDKWINKRWDTGVYIDKKQPENVFYFPAEIQIRANWDVEESWILP